MSQFFHSDDMSQLLLVLLFNMFNLNHINFLNYIVNFRICQEMLYEINNLLAPPSPVMVNVMSPVVYPGRDILLLEQGIHLTGTVEQFFLPGSLTYTHDDFPFGR